MKYVRFFYENAVGFGQLRDHEIDVLAGDFLDGCSLTGKTLPADMVRILPPVVGQIFAVGLNYRDHAAELCVQETPDFPTFFVKLPHTVVGPEDAILYPSVSKRVDYEAELAIVLGKDCYHACLEQARQAIFGFTCLNDVTARDLQKTDGQWTRCKNFETFCPLGPCVETDTDGWGLDVVTSLNGKIVQRGNTSDMLFNPTELVRQLSQVIPLKKR